MILLQLPTALAKAHLEDLRALGETESRRLMRDLLTAALVLEAHQGEAFSTREIDEAQRLLGIHGPLEPLPGEGA